MAKAVGQLPLPPPSTGDPLARLNIAGQGLTTQKAGSNAIEPRSEVLIPARGSTFLRVTFTEAHKRTLRRRETLTRSIEPMLGLRKFQ